MEIPAGGQYATAAAARASDGAPPTRSGPAAVRATSSRVHGVGQQTGKLGAGSLP